MTSLDRSSPQVYKAGRTDRLIYRLSLAAIVLLAAYTRLAYLDLAEFLSDEAIAAGMARWYIENLQFPLIGLKSSVGVFNGPFFIILIAIPLAISRDPVLATGFVALLNVLGVLVGYWFIKDYFGWRTALVSSLLFATSPWAVTFSRKIWCQDLLPPFTILFFAALFAVAIRKKGWQFVLACLWLSLAIQVHLAALAFAPLLILVPIFFRTGLKYVAMGAAAFLLPFAPYFYFEVTSGFLNTHDLMRTVGERSVADLESVRLAYELLGSPGFAALTPPSLQEFMASVSPFVWSSTLEAWLFIAGVAYLAFRVVVSVRGKTRQATKYVLLLVWLLLPLAFFARHSYEMQLHYMIVLFPMPFIAIGLLLTDAAELIVRRGMPIVAGGRPALWGTEAPSREVVPGVSLNTLAEPVDSRDLPGPYQSLAFGVVMVTAALIAGAHALLFQSFINFIQENDVHYNYGIPLRYQLEAANVFTEMFEKDKGAVAYVAAHDPHRLPIDYLVESWQGYKRFDDRAALVFRPESGDNLYLIVDPEGSSLAGEFLSATPAARPLPLVTTPGKTQSIKFFRIAGDSGFSLEKAAAYRPVDVSFANTVRLLSYSVEGRAVAGEKARVALLWKIERSPNDSNVDLVIFTHLVDSEGRQWGGEDTSAYPSSEWQAGDEFITWHDLPIANEAARGQYWIEVGLYDRQTIRRASTYDAGGNGIGNSVRLGPIKVSSREPQVLDEAGTGRRVAARFGDRIALLSYALGGGPHDAAPADNLASQSMAPGGTLNLTLYWHALQDVEADYTVFVHLLDASDRIVAQQDSRPVHGTFPTSLWDKDDVIKDEYRLSIPSDAAPGPYRIAVGMYSWPDMKRLAIYDSQGQQIGDRILTDAIEIRN